MEHSYLVLRRKALAILVGTFAASVVALAPHTEVRAAVPATSYGIVKVIPVGDDPADIAITPNGAFAYVTNAGSDNVSVIDTATGTVSATITVGDGPSAIAINPAGTLAYVTNAGSGNVSVIDTTTSPPVVTATVTVGTTPASIAINPAGTLAYVTNAGSGNVSVIDTTTSPPVVTATVTVGTSPQDVAINPSGTRAYVTNYSGQTISVINTSTSAVVHTTPTQGSNLQGIAINASGEAVIIDQSGWIQRFDLDTYASSGGSGGLNFLRVAAAGGGSSLFYGITSTGTLWSYNYGAPGSGLVLPMGTVGTTASTLAVAPNSEFPIYVAKGFGDDTVTVIDKLTPTITPQTGAAGTAVTVNVVPTNITYDIDDNAVTDVKFGGVAATAITPDAGNTWTATAPAGSGAAAVVVTFGWLQQPNPIVLFYRQASAGTFTYPASSPAVPIRQVSLDPGGGTCLDVTTRTEPWLSVFVGYRYIPGARDCTRPGHSFVGWAERTTPTTIADLALLDDPTDNVPRYFISRDADLVAVWTLVPKAPSVFVGISNWLCRNCGILLFWNAPTTQTGPTITTGSGVAVCSKPDNLLSLGDWTMCHERTGAPGTYNLSQGTTKLSTTIR